LGVRMSLEEMPMNTAKLCRAGKLIADQEEH
jgi:hypothetical protein